MPFTDAHDSSKEKVERRRTLYKECRRNSVRTLLATNYPGQAGQKFVKSQLVRQLGLKVTLCEFTPFSKTYRKAMGESVTLAGATSVFFQMLSNEYDALDLDLCNGMKEDDMKSIEQCTSWKVIVLTISNKYRHKLGFKSACPTGTHIQNFITEWCEKNGWGCKLSFSPRPYQRRLLDKRCPVYYTFIITRHQA